MKKTLAALAVLGAFAGTSLAADVTLYGVIDTGLNWTQSKDAKTGDKKDTFEMKSGQNSGPRFGLKGTEQLGNGLVVGFNLENSFNSDDGALGQGGRLFGREAIVYVRGGFGEVAFGRTGSLDAGTGSYNLIGTKATPMGLGWADTGKESYIFCEGARYDNTVTYKSPTFAGVTLYAQASLKEDTVTKATTELEDGSVVTTTALKDAGDEGSSKANRYYAVGAMAKAGALNGGLVVSMQDYSRTTIGSNGDDGVAATAYVNYDFGMIKPMFAAQYFDQGDVAGAQKGYGVVAGFTAPVAGGKAYLTAGYRDAELVANSDVKVERVMVGAAYEYPLSKRTFVYTAVGYNQEDRDDKAHKATITQAMAGLVHKF